MFCFSSKENEWDVATFFDSGRISEEKIEKVKSQLTMLCTELVKNNEFTHQNKMRLNDFYFNILKNDGIKKELWEFDKSILILSHGNASVESSFSINKDLITVNMLKESIVQQKVVYDATLSYNLEIDQIPISECMIKMFRGAKKAYNTALESKRQQESSVQIEKIIKEKSSKRQSC